MKMGTDRPVNRPNHSSRSSTGGTSNSEPPSEPSRPVQQILAWAAVHTAEVAGSSPSSPLYIPKTLESIGDHSDPRLTRLLFQLCSMQPLVRVHYLCVNIKRDQACSILRIDWLQLLILGVIHSLAPLRHEQCK